MYERTFDALEPPKRAHERSWTTSSITPPMSRALYDRLIEKPEMYQDEVIVFL